MEYLVKYLVDLFNIDQVQTDYDKFDKIYSIAIVKENISIVDRARRWDILLFKEALHIKEKNSALDGLKASNELKLLSYYKLIDSTNFCMSFNFCCNIL